jgi:hypothetical protein
MRGAERRLAILVGAALLVAWAAMALSVFDPRGHWVAAAFGPPEDGNWIAVSIDGRPVTANAYSVFIEGGEPAWGRDGCNTWSFVDDGNGAGRGIETTLVACTPEPLHVAYRRLVFGPHRLEIRPDGTLRLSGQGHEALFRRAPD